MRLNVMKTNHRYIICPVFVGWNVQKTADAVAILYLQGPKALLLLPLLSREFKRQVKETDWIAEIPYIGMRACLLK